MTNSADMMRVSKKKSEPSYIFGNMAQLSLPGDRKLPDYEGKMVTFCLWPLPAVKDQTVVFSFNQGNSCSGLFIVWILSVFKKDRESVENL